MTNALAMRSIISPQALRIIVPPMANYAVSLLQDTSVVGAMYLVMAHPLGKGAQYLEARMGKGRVAI